MTAILSSVEDLICFTRFTERGDPSRYHLLYHFAEAAEQTDDPVCFRDSVGGLILLTQQDTFGGLPGAR
jgi:hypothetical protein